MAEIFASKTAEIEEREVINAQISRKLAGECMVLLENDGVLPLKKIGKIALYGAGARHTIKGGTGSGDVNSREVINIEQGLVDAGFTITTNAWLDAYAKMLKTAKAAHQAEINRLAEENHQPPFIIEFERPFKEPDLQAITEEDVKASDTDTAILVIARNSGEGADRWNKKGDYLLNDGEVKALEFLGTHYEKTIVLLNIGGVIDATVIKETAGLNAVLLTGQDGVAQTVAAAVGVQLGLGGLPAGVPDRAAVVDVDAVAVHIQWGVVVAVAGDAAQPSIPIKAVAAAGVGHEAEKVLAAQIVDPRQGRARGVDHVFPVCIIKMSEFHKICSSFAENRKRAATIRKAKTIENAPQRERERLRCFKHSRFHAEMQGGL